ncbi:MAG: SRPBCC family protein [Ilumatobacteraceae bacterium]
MNRPIDEAWAVITDVERIAPCLPGAQLQEIEGEIYRGVVKIKLGSIAPQFKGEANFVERDDTAHRAVLKAKGRDTGGRGNAAAEIVASAESLSPTSTRVVVTTDLHITGKVAQFGRGIIGDVSKKLMAQFAGNLNTMLDEQGTPPSPDEPATPADAPADAEVASDDAPPSGKGDEAPSALGADVPAAADQGPAAAPVTAPTATPEPPRVRKVDSPASEPVDLAGVAGPAILKRAAPVVGVLLLLLLVVRRRRRHH